MNKKILWLASWYPNKIDHFTGDFIQRHARAASLYNQIYVIHTLPDKTGTITTNIREEVTETGRLTEHLIYFSASDSFFGRLASFLKWRSLSAVAIKKYIEQHGKPDLIHVHVGVRAGLLALWAQRKFKIPFVLTEHWAGFSAEAKNNFTRLPLASKLLWRRVARRAASLSTVSSYLGNLLMDKFSLKRYTVIPNVVNTSLFRPIDKHRSSSYRFIHVSRLDYQKNPEGILAAFAIVKQTHEHFNLAIVGPVNEKLQEMADRLALRDHVHFYEEMPQSELAKHVAESDALILFSRYESFGCVLIEANACGVPVIVSNLPVVLELIHHGVNGVVVKTNDPLSLAQAIKEFMTGKYEFVKTAIAEATASKYSYEIVGKQFNDWYETVISTTKNK